MGWRVGAVAWGGAFSPLDVGWEHVYWTEGPEFQALGLADGATVTTWPDEVSTADLTNGNASQRPTYVASDATFGAPVVRFDGSDDDLHVDWPDISQPFEIVMVARFRALGSDWLFSAAPSMSGASIRDSGGAWRFGVSATLNGGTVNTTKHLHRAVVNGASSSFLVDEVSILSGDVGAGSQTGLTLARSSSGLGPAQLDVAFFGIVSGALTAQERSDLHAWSQATYGTA